MDHEALLTAKQSILLDVNPFSFQYIHEPHLQPYRIMIEHSSAALAIMVVHC